MCTVTYIKHQDQYFLTSNRDENINRPAAIHPHKNVVGDIHLYYPEDPQGKGTWFCVNKNGAVCILLNGAQKKHISQGPYRKSRGIVLLELIIKQQMKAGWEEMNLENIEPFTIVAFSNGLLYQLRWDGSQKESIQLNPDESHIWASSTLYSDGIISQKKSMFDNFLNENKLNIDGDKILTFHSSTKKEDTVSEIQSHTNEIVITKNITQCVITKTDFTLTHLDLLTKEKSTQKISISKK
jgi:uncharacterized protein with NRDE domain